MNRVDGKIAIITGGAGGLGRSHAEFLIREGARVVLADLASSKVEAAATALGPSAVPAHLDVTSSEDWARVLDTTRTCFGEPDVLVNAAGIISFGPLFDISDEAYRRVIEVNQVGVFLGMRTIGAAMAANGGGSIINISSTEGLVGSPGITAYVASKHAVIGMTKAAALELAPANIRVNALAPGAIDTAMLEEVARLGLDPAAVVAETTPLARMGQPAEVSSLVVFLASDESTYCTGATFSVDGGVVAK